MVREDEKFMNSNKINIILIPDGNRRTADKWGWSYQQAYNKSAQNLDTMIKWFLAKKSVKNFIVYAISYDNIINRAQEELLPIFNAQEEQYSKWLEDDYFASNKIRIKFVGELELLPTSYFKYIEKLEEATQHHDGKCLYILSAYSSKKEIKRNLLGHKSSVKTHHIDPLLLLDVPINIDFVIRTGGYKRLSDALLYQCSYAEFIFLSKDFLEIEISDLEKMWEELSQAVTNFGK